MSDTRTSKTNAEEVQKALDAADTARQTAQISGLQWHTQVLAQEVYALRDELRWARRRAVEPRASEPPDDVRRDAERYRFLRQPGNAIVYARDRDAWGDNVSGHVKWDTSEQLDAAIDKAIGAAVTKSGTELPSAGNRGEKSEGLHSDHRVNTQARSSDGGIGGQSARRDDPMSRAGGRQPCPGDADELGAIAAPGVDSASSLLPHETSGCMKYEGICAKHYPNACPESE